MFKLNIECTKDISFLKINFADGTSTVLEDNPSSSSASQKTSKLPKKEYKEPKVTSEKSQARKKYVNDFLPTELNRDEDGNTMFKSQNVKLPELPDIDRPVKVADELQNLDI